MPFWSIVSAIDQTLRPTVLLQRILCFAHLWYFSPRFRTCWMISDPIYKLLDAWQRVKSGSRITFYCENNDLSALKICDSIIQHDQTIYSGSPNGILKLSSLPLDNCSCPIMVYRESEQRFSHGRWLIKRQHNCSDAGNCSYLGILSLDFRTVAEKIVCHSFQKLPMQCNVARTWSHCRFSTIVWYISF